MRNQLQRNLVWNAFGNLFYAGIQWLITVMVTRNSGLEDAGILSLAMSVSTIFQTIAFWGMRNYQVSDMEEKYTDNTYIKSRIDTCILSLVLCIGFALISLYDLNQLIAILCVMCFRISEGFSDVLHGICQKNGRLDLAGKGFALKGTAIAVMFSIGYFLFHSLNAGLFCMAVGVICVTVLYDYQTSIQFHVSKISTGKHTDFILLKETFPLCICAFLQSSILSAPKLLLERICGGTVLGIYSSVFAPAMLLQAAGWYIVMPFVGSFSEFYRQKDGYSFKKLFLQICFCITILCFCTIFLVKFMGWWVLNLIFGPVLAGYEYLLIPILICIYFIALLGLVCMLSVVVRDFSGQVIACLLGLIVGVFATKIFIPIAGVNGTSYGLLSGIIVAGFVIVLRLNKILQLQFNISVKENLNKEN